MYKFKNIMAAIDLENYEGDAFDYAIEQASCNEAVLTVLYVCPNYSLPNLDAYIPADVHRKVFDAYKEKLEKLCKEKIPDKVDWEAVVHKRTGHTSYLDIINTAKERNTDLVVIGEHDKHGVDHIWLGSNAEKIVRYAPCSVMVVKKKKS